MKDNNLKPIEAQKKPFETVQELKDYKVPSYEEFMENYQNDNLNYDDLTDESISSKGYGPCSSCGWSGRSASNTFKLKIVLNNSFGSSKSMTVCNTESARKQSEYISDEGGYWRDEFLEYYSAENRQRLVNKINRKIEIHKDGNDVDETIYSRDESGSNKHSTSQQAIDIMSSYQ